MAQPVEFRCAVGPEPGLRHDDPLRGALAGTHALERELGLGTRDYCPIRGQHRAAHDDVAGHGLHVPAVLEPGLPLLLRKEMRVDDGVGLDDGLLRRNLRRGDADASIKPEVRVTGGDQANVPVDS